PAERGFDMNGIEKITGRITADAQAETERILTAAREEAAQITARYKAQADAESADLAAKNAKAAVEREERLVSVAQMEARKVQLAAKQEMVEKTYALALEKLCAMPEEQYVQVLADLLVQASSTGREEVIFSPADRDRVGKAAVAKANELLAKQAAPDVPQGSSKVTDLLSKVATSVTALAKGTALLALSKETRPIKGGFILKDENVEVNCTFDTLVRLQKAETAGMVAKKLFPEA
ncbi:V-type ATP synthase subunit E, partial [uncultured Oscillibacter sp.]|uniref:V-type ATP synthase subunit E n=2 Tax=uncultured Oscillibacter sp. TaxID=876091 RepID=UPI0026003F76